VKNIIHKSIDKCQVFSDIVKNLPQVAYLKMTGAQQGLISAGANTRESMGFNKYQQDHPDEITVIRFDHQIMIPLGPQTGQPTGQRVHKPLCFTKRYDKSSPWLYQALCCGERLTEVEIKWYRTTREGTQEHYFTHRLRDAIIVNIQANMVLATDVSQDYREPEETICIMYNEIEWTHEVAGTSSWDGGMLRSNLNKMITVKILRTEYLDNPLAIDTYSPRLSWQIGERATYQSAYQIQVAKSLAD